MIRLGVLLAATGLLVFSGFLVTVRIMELFFFSDIDSMIGMNNGPIQHAKRYIDKLSRERCFDATDYLNGDSDDHTLHAAYIGDILFQISCDEPPQQYELNEFPFGFRYQHDEADILVERFAQPTAVFFEWEPGGLNLFGRRVLSDLHELSESSGVSHALERIYTTTDDVVKRSSGRQRGLYRFLIRLKAWWLPSDDIRHAFACDRDGETAFMFVPDSYEYAFIVYPIPSQDIILKVVIESTESDSIDVENAWRIFGKMRIDHDGRRE